jgi:hypothetical protein
MPHPLTGPAVGFFSRLKHPTLFKLTIGLMVVSWLLPDPLPFLDEIVSALAVMVLANWRKPAEAVPPEADPRVIDGESRRE